MGLSENQAISFQFDEIIAFRGALILSNRTATPQSLVLQRGKIFAIGGEAEAIIRNNHDSIQVIDATGYSIGPGLINSHTHLAMNVLRDKCHVSQNMIEDVFFPFESNLTEELLAPLSFSGIYDGLRSGTTCFVDHYYMIEGVGAALERFGVRGAIGETIADLGGAFPSSEIWTKTKKSIEQWKFSDLITPVLAPHATDTVSPNLFRDMANFSKSKSIPLHFHLSQTETEARRSIENSGLTPTALAMSYGALTENALAVHLVSANTEDLKILANSGCTVGYCPSSQTIYEKLAPIAGFLENKIPFAVGTDCAASNDSFDLLSEIKFAAMTILDRYEGVDPHVLPKLVLDSVTSQPAKALSLNHIGSLEKGKAADLVFVKNSLDTLPIYDPLTHFVFSTQSRNVEHVMVNGKWVLWKQRPTCVDESSATLEYVAAVKTINERAQSK